MIESKPWPTQVLACFFAFVITTGMVTVGWVTSLSLKYSQAGLDKLPSQNHDYWFLVVPFGAVGVVSLVFWRHLPIGIPVLAIIALLSAFTGLQAVWDLGAAPVAYYFVPVLWIVLPGFGCLLLLSERCRVFFRRPNIRSLEGSAKHEQR